MSGKILSRVSALSLALLLAACGGDGDSTPLVNTSGGGTENSGGTGDPGGGDPNDPADPSAPVPPQGSSLAIGYFDSTGNFVAGKIKSNTAALTITSDESKQRAASLEVAVVDTANSNSLVLGSDNDITFFSACASSEWAQITPPTISAEAGTVLAEYTPNERCIGEDTLFARLNDNYEIKADVTFTNTPEVATAPPLLKVGSFDGDNFQLDVIRASNPVLTIPSSGVAETQLRVAIVDQTDTKIVETSYNVAFTSVCLDAGRATIDNTPGITDSGEVLATYTASAECLGLVS